jgi:hypothetical protein
MSTYGKLIISKNRQRQGTIPQAYPNTNMAGLRAIPPYVQLLSTLVIAIGDRGHLLPTTPQALSYPRRWKPIAGEMLA